MSLNIPQLLITSLPNIVTASLVFVSIRYFKKFLDRIETRRSNGNKVLASMRVILKGDVITLEQVDLPAKEPENTEVKAQNASHKS